MSLFWLRRPHVLLLFIDRSAVGRCALNIIVVTGIVLSLLRVGAPRRGVLIVLTFGGIALPAPWAERRPERVRRARDRLATRAALEGR